MKKKQYIIPLFEVTDIRFGGALLTSPEYPIPPIGPAPARKTELF